MTLYKYAIPLPKIQDHLKDIEELADGEAIQLLNKNGRKKVVLDQDYFFTLLTAKNIAFPSMADPLHAQGEMESVRLRARGLMDEHRKILEEHA